MEYQFADYFENEVLRKRSFLKRDWAIKVIENSLNSEEQPDGRTILNMFPDRSFKQ